jgi:hypothetical protein
LSNGWRIVPRDTPVAISSVFIFKIHYTYKVLRISAEAKSPCCSKQTEFVMKITRIDKSRPVVYKNHKIIVTKAADRRYVFTIKKSFDIELTGVTSTLDTAFEEARAMIDKMEDQ